MNTTWRWIFWSTSIFDVLVQVVALFFLSETFAPTILARKADKIRNDHRQRRVDGILVRTEHETGDRFSKILRKRLILPFIMMFTHPAVQAPAIYRAYLYGVMYLVLSTFPLVFEDAYGMETGTASLNYLSLCLGFMIGLQLSHPLMDKVSFAAPSLCIVANNIAALCPPQNLLQHLRRRPRMAHSAHAYWRHSVSYWPIHLRLECISPGKLPCPKPGLRFSRNWPNNILSVLAGLHCRCILSQVCS
jgi:hypothetical protein